MSAADSHPVPVGVHNMRSIGGAGGVPGPRLRPGRLWRSSAPLREHPGLADDLHQLGVRTVLDLRDDSERRLAPALVGDELVLRWVPVFGNELGGLVWDQLTDLYELMLTRFARQLASAVGVIADAMPGPVLVHCTAGKDRTGVVCALVQETLGVSRERILADYRLSAELLGEDYLADLSRVTGRGRMAGEAAHRATASPSELLATTLDRLEERGGVRDFLLDNGCSADQLDRLAEHLLDKE
ncbi:tyrosine-protein phosphatase [Tessaracoccus sp. SD287]|uniref:tyrosine-protein phosphatase n=1 Tax=Tessaracoccus sp. SD287 TaxID=2782008 RepID=UPI001A96F47B|nr:tyrosine-protein phosphatase [Tessaracoccus sp. SD287]MBO1030943.1 tyrosine-protein phosphatase [Tessaracoccus sp. SD287]